jgi:hypothetical protein
MSYIATWLNEQLQAKTADLLVNDTLNDLRTRSGMLSKYVPIKNYDSRNFLSYVIKEINVIASIIAYGATPPISRQGSFTKITAEMLKSGLTYRFDENDQWDLRDALRMAVATASTVQDVPAMNGSGGIMKGTNNDLASYIFGRLASAVKAQLDLLDVMAWQCLTTGQVSWTDTREAGAQVVLNYIDPTADYNHFPGALSGVDLWTATATANGIQNLFDGCSTFVDTNGYRPDATVMSWKTRNDLMQQESTKNAASSLTVTQVGQVSKDMLNAIMEARDLPPIVTFDEQYELENPDKSVSKLRFMPTTHYAFLSEGMGQRAIGATIEGDDDPTKKSNGIYVVAREIEKVPPVDAIQTTMTSIPVFPNPKKLFAQQVTAA